MITEVPYGINIDNVWPNANIQTNLYELLNLINALEKKHYQYIAHNTHGIIVRPILRNP